MDGDEPTLREQAVEFEQKVNLLVRVSILMAQSQYLAFAVNMRRQANSCPLRSARLRRGLDFEIRNVAHLKGSLNAQNTHAIQGIESRSPEKCLVRGGPNVSGNQRR